ncbi:hypothetical protein AQ749_25885 [Burkholderia pseudomallei]|nr:hypothetical protein VP95_09635 [Burkholderia pseudomallei]OMS94879.1 hypothetical protein AQ749_25885 [Burkholderia pseudomallei]ONA23404.1 hypothetical protein AQ877_13755 [Burkholderia pseudomallei]ONC38320.1 hypothetical protein AQ914_21390 [Burkholderia pseudomallei]OND55869.1 hypothetical protein AQ936_19870 [Burkholderia pseudomallei]
MAAGGARGHRSRGSGRRMTRLVRRRAAAAPIGACVRRFGRRVRSPRAISVAAPRACSAAHGRAAPPDRAPYRRIARNGLA